MPGRPPAALAASGGNGHAHARHLLLDPRFLIQLAGILLSAAGLYFALLNNQEALAREQLRQGNTLEKIEARLPNSEALDLRLKQIEGEVAGLRGQVKDFDGWVRVTREQLAAERAQRGLRDGG